MPEPGLGREAETLAAAWLGRRGLMVVETNCRTAAGELDLVAWDGPVLVFVEVKARSRSDHGRPEEAVDAAKRARLADAARAYLAGLPGPTPICRFDVVAVDAGCRPPRLVHLADAFRPEA